MQFKQWVVFKSALEIILKFRSICIPNVNWLDTILIKVSPRVRPEKFLIDSH